MKLFFIVFGLLFGSAQASVGDDLGRLLERFFITPAEESSPPVVSDTPVSLELSSDIAVVQAQIINAENDLALVENRLQSLSQQLATLPSVNEKIQNQLWWLDSALSEQHDQSLNLASHQQQWQEEIADLTTQRHQLAALIRQRQREYQKQQNALHWRRQLFGGENNFLVTRWLLGDRWLSTLLREQSEQKNWEKKSAQQLQELNELQNNLLAQEKYAALLLGQWSLSQKNLQKNTDQLNTIAQQKADLLASQSRQLDSLQQQNHQLRQQQARLTTRLQALHEHRQTLINAEPVSTPAWRWPVEPPINISAGFADPQYQKQLGRTHQGLDIVVPQGALIRSIADGVVKQVITHDDGYSSVEISHKNDYVSHYGHLSDILVSIGQIINSGQTIALSGGTPGTPGAGFWSNGPHLHLGIYHQESFIDPLVILPTLTE